MEETRKKIIIIGDRDCGKSCLIRVFLNDEFPTGYLPYGHETHDTCIKLDGAEVPIRLWDIQGPTDYDRIRPLSYPNTDAVLICFSMTSPRSLQTVSEKWWPEVRHHSYDAIPPVVLVGTKEDLRNDKGVLEELKKVGQEPVKLKQALKVAKCIGAVQYMECSAKAKTGIREVFEIATRCAFMEKKKRHLPHRCIYL